MSIEIYSTDTDSGILSVIERTNGHYQPAVQITVGNAPRGAVKFTKDGRGYVCNTGGNTISEIDVILHQETGRIKVGPAPRGLGIVPGDRYALVSNSGENSISIIDLLARAEIGRSAVGRDPRHMAITSDGRWAYIAIWGAHHVSKFHVEPLTKNRLEDWPSHVRETRRIQLKPESHPYSVAIDPSGKHVYVANTQATYLPIISIADDKVEAEVELGYKGARAVTFSPDGAFAYVTVEYISEVCVIDTATHQVVNWLPAGVGPRGLAIDPQGNTLYVADFYRTAAVGRDALSPIPNPGISVVDLTGSGTILEILEVGKGPCSVSVLNLETLTL